MIAGASLWALHTTVTGKKVAAVALGDTMGIVLTHKLVTAHVQQGHTAAAILLLDCHMVVVVVAAAVLSWRRETVRGGHEEWGR